MGVDTIIELDPRSRVRDVAKVMGKLLDEPATIERFALSDTVEINTATRGFLYHFEGRDGTRSLHPASTAQNIAMGVALVEFFGGQLWYQDMEGTTVPPNYEARPPDPHSPEEDEEWEAWQLRIEDVLPLGRTDIAPYEAKAAYKKGQ